MFNRLLEFNVALSALYIPTKRNLQLNLINKSKKLNLFVRYKEILMETYQDERIGIFIDGHNLYSATRALEFDIDYKKLLEFFKGKSRMIRAFYYTALLVDHEHSTIRPLVDWLSYNGYTVVTKPAKEFLDFEGRRKIKGNMDIELSVDIMEMTQHLDHIKTPQYQHQYN